MCARALHAGFRLLLWAAVAFAAAPSPAVAAPGADEALAPFRAADWEIRQGRWRFEPSGALLSEGSPQALIYHRGPAARDIDLTVEIMFLGPESSAGLVFRAEGADYRREVTFYQLEWYTRGSHHDRRLSLMVKNPRWKQIVKPVYREPPVGRALTLRVRAKGERVECFVDGVLVFAVRDRSFLRPGRLGLHVWQPRAVRFLGFRLAEP
jgi:hypothetical protein